MFRKCGTLSRCVAATFVLSAAAVGAWGTDVVFTVAGGGSLDGYHAEDANLELGGSLGLAIDPLTGDLFMSDTGHHQVLRIDPTTGIIRVVAGSGARAYYGDGGPAASAGLSSPGALVFDSKGNLYIVDRGNYCVRRVDVASGIITTVAGNGHYTGEPIPGGGNYAIGDGGTATSATFSTAMGGIAVSESADGATVYVYVADSGNHVIRKFSIAGGTTVGTINTICGQAGASGFAGDDVYGGATTAVRLNGPTGIVLEDSPANATAPGIQEPPAKVYIGDSGNRRVRRLDVSTNTVTTIAGSGGGAGGFDGDGGAATAATIGSLGGLAFDSAGNLLIVCTGANCVRKVNVGATTPIITTVAGRGGATIGDGGPATDATFGSPTDISVDASDNFYVYDGGHDRIRRVDAATKYIYTVAGTGLSGFIGDGATKSQIVLNGPRGCCFDSAGNLYIADTGNNAVRKVAADGTVSTIAGTGQAGFTGDGGLAILANLDSPRDVAMLDEDTLLIADMGNDCVRAVNLTDGIISTYNAAALNGSPYALAVSSGGVVYVAVEVGGGANDEVQQIATDKTVTTYFTGLNNPRDLYLASNGDLYVAEAGAHVISKLAAGAPVVRTVVAGTNGSAGFSGDGGLATAAELDGPTGVSLDVSGSRLLISDTNNERIRAVNMSSGIISTIAGDGTEGLSGDGGPAAGAKVNGPGNMFLYGGMICFADVNNNRIRAVASANDIAAEALAFKAKLKFSIEKKTGGTVNGKDSISVKAALTLPAGATAIPAANLRIALDIADLHLQTVLDANGKQVKPPKLSRERAGEAFDYEAPEIPRGPLVKVKPGFRETLDEGETAKFSLSAKGTFRGFLGRLGMTDETTATPKTINDVPIVITLGNTVFYGAVDVEYKAVQNKGGSAKTVKP
ncbi:MAG: hypothetical protein N3A38_05095 [Planctomycetota bacterium]|nr:hypothetical protein [Planctomycetota bacterium]